MNNMREQGERWGAVFETEDVESVDFSARPLVVRSTSRIVRAHTVIIATGKSQEVCHSWKYDPLPVPAFLNGSFITPGNTIPH